MKRIIVAVFAMLFAGSATASCPGITQDYFVDGTWVTHTLSGLLTEDYEFDISSIGGQTVEVYANGAWSAVGAGIHEGSKLRFSVGGELDASYRVGDCEDIIEPNDN